MKKRRYCGVERVVEKDIEALQDYLYETLHLRVKAKPWKEEGSLPFFLQDEYAFYEVSLLKHACLLMVAKGNSLLSPATIRKHWEIVQQSYPRICIFIQGRISAYNRSRLIEHHIPFIIPGNQMYLPDLGIDLREHFQKLHTRTRQSFSPATQAVIIYALLHGTHERFIPSELAKNLRYTLMTMTRAFDELQAANIGEVSYKGKERWWLFAGSKQELWEQARPLMRSPVKSVRNLLKKPPPIIRDVYAGLSALSRVSMIQAPQLEVFAVGPDKWDTLKQAGWEEAPEPAVASCELEIWRYDPLLFKTDNMVDSFSLYLSLIQDADERTEMALDEMMEKIIW